MKLLVILFLGKINAFLICSNQEYYCRLFWKVCFCICPLSFFQTSKSVLIIEAMQICTFVYNYWKCVNSKSLRVIMLLYASAYILEFSRKRNIIKTSMMRCVFNVVANCRVQVTKSKFFAANLFQLIQ